MSYRKRHIKSKIHRIKPRKSIFKRLSFWIAILTVLLIGCVAYLILFYSALQVNSVVVIGNEKVSSKEIESIVQNDINHNFFSIGSWHVSSRSFFLISSSKISKDVLGNFSIIESVNVSKDFPRTINVKIGERHAVGKFCPINGEVNSCYPIDKNGIIFGALTESYEELMLIRRQVDDGKIFIGEQIVQQNIINMLLRIENDLKDKFKIAIKEAVIASPSRVDIITGENWRIFFQLGSDSDTLMELTKLDLLLSGGISDSERNNLRYVDLRPKDRAIICDNDTCGK